MSQVAAQMYWDVYLTRGVTIKSLLWSFEGELMGGSLTRVAKEYAPTKKRLTLLGANSFAKGRKAALLLAQR
ncbi:hypothetical protein [Pseudomonas boanensis]|uniref:hypothetical protein n=1 Tax=Metapseudomonas boanensis TaxID=2822138 RepID=UPI0035D40E5A